jgi:hypothetical protein
VREAGLASFDLKRDNTMSTRTPAPYEAWKGDPRSPSEWTVPSKVLWATGRLGRARRHGIG